MIYEQQEGRGNWPDGPSCSAYELQDKGLDTIRGQSRIGDTRRTCRVLSKVPGEGLLKLLGIHALAPHHEQSGEDLPLWKSKVFESPSASPPEVPACITACPERYLETKQARMGQSVSLRLRPK